MLLDPTDQTEPIGIRTINRIICAVGVQIQCLRIQKTGGLHARGIDLRESPLSAVIVAVHGIVEVGSSRTVVAGEAAVGCAS